MSKNYFTECDTCAFKNGCKEAFWLYYELCDSYVPETDFTENNDFQNFWINEDRINKRKIEYSSSEYNDFEW